MLWGVEILARGLLSIASSLDRVVASRDATILYLDVGWRMGELALRVGPRALVALKLPANLELKPAGILHVHQVVYHGHSFDGAASDRYNDEISGRGERRPLLGETRKNFSLLVD